MKAVAIIAAALLALCLGMIIRLDKARAQAVCGQEKQLLDGLAAHSHEFVVLTGELISGKRMIVTMAGSGSFSIIESDGNIACMVAAGEKAEIDNGV
jgi:hypothetical protein